MLTADIVIPCVPQHVRLLPECVACMVQQTVLPDSIFIALSNTSPSAGQELETTLRHQASFDRIHVLSTTETMLAGPNRNRGADACTSDIVCFVDADDLTLPTKLERVLHVFAREPNVLFRVARLRPRTRDTHSRQNKQRRVTQNSCAG